MINLIKKVILFISNTKCYWYNKFILKNKRVSYSQFPKINGKIFIRNYGNIFLGNDVIFNSSSGANPIGGDTRMTIVVENSATLKIGNGTGISNSAIICHDRIIIGDDVKIGGSVKIYDTDFHSLDPRKRNTREKDIPNTKPVTIGNSVFIGAHSIILKGVTLGNNSIVGAGSVVTKSVPAGEIWAGNPAKFIKNVENDKFIE